jgi:YidC/Oxa1 family membrane protein insertase
MAQERSPVLRILIPLLVMVAAVGFAIAVFTNTARHQNPPAGSTTPAATATTAPAQTAAAPTATAPAAETSTTPATAEGAAPTPTTTAQVPPASPAPAAPPAPINLSAKPWSAEEAGLPFASLGSLQRESEGNTLRVEVHFSPNGAGVDSLKLANHFSSIERNAPNEILQQAERHVIPMTDGSVRERTLVPFALLGLSIDGTFVNLAVAPEGSLWRQVSPGEFVARIVDDQGREAVSVTRRYRLREGGYDLVLEQSLRNLTGRAINVTWHQFGPVDLPIGVIRYGGDVRRIRLGYLRSLQSDPNQQVVFGGDRFMIPHATALGSPTMDATGQWAWPEFAIWPEARAKADGLSLSWAALTNRYFAVAVHPIPERQPGRQDTATPNAIDRRFNLVQTIDRVVLERGGADKNDMLRQAVMALRITSGATVVAPGATMDATMGVYAGPISTTYTEGESVLREMGLGGLVLFSFGGPCAFCTFQPVAYLLRWYLGVLATYVVFDWAVAIILLVVTLRTLLHPVTRWSQKSMTRFGKQMAALAPKQQRLKEQYGHDPARFREEVAKLMKEEQVNYAGALGCLPMFFQMPIWVALYAMIFFTFELRHEAAFFGLFQAISGGNWTFMADLSEPDHFLNLGLNLHIPFISGLMGPIDGLNVLPILMGVVFYFQQKYLTPPTTTQLTPEQELQMKLSKGMIVFLFPLMMYNAPAALSLYFMTNSIGGIIESKWIRAQVEREDAEREKLKAEGKWPPKRTTRGGAPGPDNPKPGLIERFRLALEAKQREVEQRQARSKKKP